MAFQNLGTQEKGDEVKLHSQESHFSLLEYKPFAIANHTDKLLYAYDIIFLSWRTVDL